MPRFFCLLCLLWAGRLLLSSSPGWAQPQPDSSLVGTWEGTLQAPGAALPLRLHLSPDGEGTLTASLDSPAQDAFGLQVDDVTVSPDSLYLRLSHLDARYAAVRLADSLHGVWQQSGLSLPLAFHRISAEPSMPGGRAEGSARVRPQEPTPPFPYHVEEVTILHEAAEVQLAGTLTLPQGDGPFPAALLISGSGPQDRDETIFGHRPFWLLADYLTRRGIAVLRFDDRGVGASTGVFEAATTEDFAADVQAVLDFLATRADIDRAQTGLIGHSEGGLVAAMVAAQEAVAFLVLLATPGLPGEQVLYQQNERIATARGAPPEAVALNRSVQERVFEVLKQEDSRQAAETALRDVFADLQAELSDAEQQTLGLSDAAVQAQVRMLSSPWFRFFLTYDPAADLQQVEAPVLAVTGEKDLQVPSAENLPAIEAALEAGGHADYTARALPGLNHLFQQAETGLPTEYAQIEQTFDPEALALIASWIREQVGRPPE